MQRQTVGCPVTDAFIVMNHAAAGTDEKPVEGVGRAFGDREFKDAVIKFPCVTPISASGRCGVSLNPSVDKPRIADHPLSTVVAVIAGPIHDAVFEKHEVRTAEPWILRPVPASHERFAVGS